MADLGLNDTQRHAMRAVAQWELGDRGWADELIAIAEADDPEDTARAIIGDEDFERVWRESAR